MERLSVFLERLKAYLDLDIYEGTPVLAPQLRPTVYRVLEHFLTIMGITYKLTRGWKGKLKLALKVGAFGDDEGVQDALARLETLVWDVTKIEITTILQNAGEAARNIRGTQIKVEEIAAVLGRNTETLQSVAKAVGTTATSLGHLETADQQRTVSEEQEKCHKHIREALFSTDSVKRSWESRQSQLRAKHIKGTGDWLLNHSCFRRWANVNETGPNALYIRAEEGFGKSYLCSSVIQHLMNKYAEEPRVALAYYYFQNELSDNYERHNPIGSALRAIVYQLALHKTALGREYAKWVSKECEHKAGLVESEDLWKRMFSKIQTLVDGTFYIVLDGIVESEGETALAKLVGQANEPSEGSRLRIRLFFTGRSRAISLINIHTFYPVAEIQLRPKDHHFALNQADLVLYARKRLNEMEIFQWCTEEGEKLRNRAVSELSTGVGGDYYLLESKLDSISRRRGFREVEDIISSAQQESREQAMIRAFNQLERDLSLDEIREVNTILNWAAVAFDPLTVSQYRAILSLDAASDQPISLEMQIYERYTSLFSIEEWDAVTLKSDGIIEHLRNNCAEKVNHSESNLVPVKSQSGLHIMPLVEEGTEQFDEAEVAIVQQVIKTYCRNTFGDDRIYDRFGFDTFFRAKARPPEKRLAPNAHIRLLSSVQCHTMVAWSCLTVICDHIDEAEYNDLTEYVWDNFAYHLSGIDDLDDPSITAATKQDIGLKLVQVLRTDRFIDAWWSEERLWYRFQRLYSDRAIVGIHNWLCDPSVRRAFKDMPEDREWVRETTRGDSPHILVLRPAAHRLANRWVDRDPDLQSIEGLVRFQKLVKWLVAYVKQVKGITPDCESPPNLADLKDAQEWVKSLEHLQNRAYNWDGCLASALAAFSFWAESVPHYEAAISRDPERWMLKLELALALGECEKPQQAVDTLSDLIEQHRDLLATDKQFETAYWETMLLPMGKWNMKLQDYTAAAQAFKPIFDRSLVSGVFTGFARQAIYPLTEALYVQEKHVEIMGLLISLEAWKLNELDNNLFTLLRIYPSEGNLHHRILTSARKTNQLGWLLSMYQQVADALPTDTLHFSNSIYIRYYHGLFLWSGKTLKEQEAALELWEKNMTIEIPSYINDMGLSVGPRLLTSSKLAVALLDSAKTTDLTKSVSEEAEAYAQRLERLTRNPSELTNWDWRSTRLTYARLRHLMGDHETPKYVLRHMMRQAFQDFEQENEQLGLNPYFHRPGIFRIAIILQALDDDVNAMAAWSSVGPLESSDDAKKTDNMSSPPVDHRDNSEEEQAQAGACNDQDLSHFMDFSNLIQKPLASTSVPIEAEVPIANNEDLKGPLIAACHGLCGSTWTYVDDIYSCKDCLDVQLCPNCYTKLMNGEMDGTICDQKHSHLHLPKFDRQKWEITPPDKMWVGDELVSKRVWADEIKREWEIDRFADLVEKVRVARRAAKKLREKA